MQTFYVFLSGPISAKGEVTLLNFPRIGDSFTHTFEEFGYPKIVEVIETAWSERDQIYHIRCVEK